MSSANFQNCYENAYTKGRRRKGQDYLKLMLRCHLIHSYGSCVKSEAKLTCALNSASLEVFLVMRLGAYIANNSFPISEAVTQ